VGDSPESGKEKRVPHGLSFDAATFIRLKYSTGFATTDKKNRNTQTDRETNRDTQADTESRRKGIIEAEDASHAPGSF